ncbi:MAG: hypothetical protein KTR31_07175 [Myxococcales bacterium]|nr:hypothetical protein [Myxococcales bacterium]
MSGNLEMLLRRIRDGQATSEEVSAARALVRADARLPEELSSVVLLDEQEAPSDAAGLLSVLGADDLGALLAQAVREEADVEHSALDLASQEQDDGWRVIADVLREHLRAEAGAVDVSEGVLRRLSIAGWPWGPVVAEAVRAEAGEVDVSAEVLREVGFRLVPVAEAVRAECGMVSLSSDVAGALELEHGVPVAEAVRAYAGSVDVVDAVMDRVMPARPSSVVVDEPRPVLANNRRFWGATAVALAAAALAMVVGLPLGGPGQQNMLFAHAGEVVVEDLSFGQDVQVLQTEGDEGAVILWLDEEA